jgi:hypothetical protein
METKTGWVSLNDSPADRVIEASSGYTAHQGIGVLLWPRSLFECDWQGQHFQFNGTHQHFRDAGSIWNELGNTHLGDAQTFHPYPEYSCSPRHLWDLRDTNLGLGQCSNVIGRVGIFSPTNYGIRSPFRMHMSKVGLGCYAQGTKQLQEIRDTGLALVRVRMCLVRSTILGPPTPSQIKKIRKRSSIH